MSVSPDPSLLREVDALRDCLAECLHRLDDLERRVRVDSVRSERGNPPPFAGPRSDPFEQALPSEEDGNPAGESTADASGRFTIRALPLSGEPHGGPEPIAPPAHPPHEAGWETDPSTGDGTPDPFAFLSVPTAAAYRAEASEVYRGMHALLGGLDVTTQDESA